MSPFDILLVVYGGILALATFAVVYRMIVGPTILDRAISSDSLVTLVVMGMALHVAHSGAAWAGPAMLSLTGLAFIGTVTFARFVAREDPMQGRRRPHPEEPGTDTGPHEAIHLETDSASEDGFGVDGARGVEDDGGVEEGFGADGTRGFGGDGGVEEGFGADGTRGFGGDGGVEDGFGADGTRGFGDEGGVEDGFGADGARGFEDGARFEDGPRTGGAR